MSELILSENMLSFIVIGKNEGERIYKCHKSICTFCNVNNINEYEIIYVDSNSVDNSIEFSKKYSDIVLRIVGDINAAVARNVGASAAVGSVLFFVDGDMELVPDFYSFAFNDGKLKYPFISGNFINNYFDKKGVYLYSQEYKRSKPKQDEEFQSTTGGLFIVSRELWKNNKGMDSKFTTGEDLDFGLRLSKQGFKLLRINQPFAYHNTLHYNDRQKLINSKEVYARALLYRKHLLNPYIYKEIFYRDTTLVFLPASIILSILFDSYIFICFYLFLIAVKSFILYRKKPFKILYNIFYQFIRDIMNILALLLYFPPKKTNYSVTLIKHKNDK